MKNAEIFVHYFKFQRFAKNPLFQENLLNKILVSTDLSTKTRESTISSDTISSVHCSLVLTKEPTQKWGGKSSLCITIFLEP